MHAGDFLKYTQYKEHIVLDLTTYTNSSQSHISKWFNDETSFLWACYLIFTYANAFHHSPCVWKNWERSHIFTSYTEFDLQHLYNNNKIITLQWIHMWRSTMWIHIQITLNNFYFELCKCSKHVASLAHVLLCFVTYSTMLILSV